MTNFAAQVNDATDNLTSTYSPGANTLNVGTGSKFGTPSPTHPIRITVIKASTYGTTSEVKTIFTATGITGNQLTGVAVAEGSTDRAYAVGDYVEARWTAAAVNDITTAVNSIETTLAAAPSTYSPIAGSVSITTVGTITTGTWSGTAIAATKGGTGLTTLGSANQILSTNLAGNALEYRTLTPGTGISVSSSAGSITVGVSTIPTTSGGTGLTAIGAANQVLGSNAAGNALEYKTLTQGTGITISHAAGSVTISATGGGTVSSVALSLPAVFSVSGSPVTTSGTITATLATQSQNTVWAGPTTGAAAAPTFRALVAADLPAHSAALITSGTLTPSVLPVFVGSGASHAIGAVPDPGATAGTAKYLREDATWATPTASVAIGSPITSATSGSILFADASGQLGQANAGLFFDASNSAVTVSSSVANAVPLVIKNSAATGKTRARIDASGANANSGFFLASGGADKFEIACVVSGGTNFSWFLYNLQTSTYALSVNGDKNRIGIGGITAPSGQLHVQATDTTTPTAIFQAVASQGASTYVVDVRDASGLTVGYFDRSGNLYTAGTLKITNYSTMGGGYWNYSSAGGGCVIQSGTGSYLLASGTPAITLGASNETIIPGTVSTGTWTGISIPHVFSTSGAQTWSSTVDVAGVRMTQAFGGGSLTHTSTTPLTALLVGPTYNLASGSTGRCVPLRVNPTYTAVGTGMIPVSILVQDGGTDRWGVDRYGRMFTASPTPNITANTGAGTSPTVSVASQTDASGVISLTTGSSPSASADVATITFSAAFTAAPKAVILTPANPAAAALSGSAAVFVDSSNTSTTAFKITVGSTALAPSTAYRWHYHVL